MKNLEKILSCVDTELVKTTCVCRYAYKLKHQRNCTGISCNICEFRKAINTLTYLNEEYKKPIKMSSFEYAVLESFLNTRSDHVANYTFGDFEFFKDLKNKGYYENVDPNLTLREIYERSGDYND